jgi:hypothetical protein
MPREHLVKRGTRSVVNVVLDLLTAVRPVDEH